MNVSLYQASAAMNAHSRWQELITHNLTAGSVPGYRKRDISFSAVEAGHPGAALNASQISTVMPAARPGTNFQPGQLRPTRNQFDFALDGPGFLEVQLPNGNKAYTRDGELHMSAQGQLVTKQGYPVVSDSGPLQFDPNNSGAITVSSNGFVSQGGDVKGTLRLVEFKDPQALTPISAGFFLADRPEAQPEAALNTEVRQGYLEGSNASPTVEMASLITSMRMFEANQRVLQMQDERMGKALSELTQS
ncbi:MAG TPA: flagellar hook-basal body protein [Verrucomicrobiae bacterium]|nr:flagellar hook-basal body protein [Verrucomicrobiae bacterium]